MRSAHVAAALAAAVLPALARGADFQITKIADTNGMLDDVQRPAINELGTVAFVPEPAVPRLVALGGLVMKRRRH